jgi:hypothetical protein
VSLLWREGGDDFFEARITAQLRVAFFREPDGELIELLEDKLVIREAWMQTIRVAPLICQVLKA